MRPKLYLDLALKWLRQYHYYHIVCTLWEAFVCGGGNIPYRITASESKNRISPAGFEPATARILQGSVTSVTDYNLALYQLSYREKLNVCVYG